MYLLPTPTRFSCSEQEHFLLSYRAYIVLSASADALSRQRALILEQKIRDVLGFSLSVTCGSPRKGDIFLEVSSAKDESYRITVNEQGITISCCEQSLIWAIQSLIQILKQSGACVPFLSLEDFPALPYRGFYHDVTRGRVSTLSYLKELADKLSEYKINQLQLYIENTHLFRDFSEVWRDDDPLTPQEIMELDNYCYVRGIELIPSISTFSHLYKVLRTKQFSYLCELEHSEDDPFDAWDKQDHHTLDITNPDSFPFVCRMIDEYRPLFRTDKFNLCADETFDLGLGRSKEYCEKIGKDKAYIEFVKKLCNHLIEIGCKPMMWGDIICEYPNLVEELPKKMTFLNWNYSPDCTDKQTRLFADANAVFYNCPGVISWSRLIPSAEKAYQNISKMADFAHRFHAVGLLNTDWGDFHHISHPKFSLMGLAAGAQCSWSQIPLSFEEFNTRFSILEFGAHCEKAASLVAQIDPLVLYPWMAICAFREYQIYHKQKGTEGVKRFVDAKFSSPQLVEQLSSSNDALSKIQRELLQLAVHSTAYGKELINAYALALDGCILLNQLGAAITKTQYLNSSPDCSPNLLAQQLEEWLYHYKKLWRTVSKESELFRITEIFCWYADWLRSL